MNRPKYYQNYHKHTSLSHRYNKDSPLTSNDYFKFMIDNFAEFPKIYSTVEHGWQGNYFKIYDDIEKINKNFNEEIVNNKPNKFYSPNCEPIKFIFGTEAYFVKDRLEKDSTNCHIVLLAKTDNARKKINRAIYESYKTGYYYKGRMDLDILLSLPKDEVFVTTACIAFWGYDKYKDDNGNRLYNKNYKETDELIFKLNEHFSDFYLELQPHSIDFQKSINKHMIELHREHNIPIIGATDSHIIDEEDVLERDDLLRSNGIHYDDEDGCYSDYPTTDEFIRRFEKQGILSQDEIYEAIENTNLILDFEDIELDRSLKVPVAKKYKHLSQEERNEIFENILRDEWNKQIEDINEDKYDQYIKEIKHDIKEIEDCNMSDYFIDNYEIMKLGIEKGGILTPSGRGSAVSMYLNKLLGFTKVDKVNSPVLMYSERFLTADRVLKSKTPPDIDHNVSKREPFIEAQKEVICEEGTFNLLALGTLKYKSAFKMYSRAYNLEPTLANEVTKLITKYEEALKYANDEDRDLIDIFDFVNEEKYGYLIEGCQQYMGIVDNLKGHPCFTKNAKVMTNKGYKNISEVVIGDMVLTIDNTFKKVLNTMGKKSTDIYTLKVQGSTPIEVTGNHPMYIANRVTTRNEYYGGNRRDLKNKRWEEVENLKKGDLIGVAVNQNSILPNIDFLDSLNNDFWWCIGRYLGDGWRSHTIRKSGKKKGQKIKDVIICCNKNNNETNDIISKLNWCDYRVSEESTTNKIYLKCKGLYDWLDEFGDYAKNKHLTNTILDLPKEQLENVIDGYLSADGHIDKNGNQSFVTISKELGLGIVACINKVYSRPCSFGIKKKAGVEYIQGRKVNCQEKYNGVFHKDDRSQDNSFYKDGLIWTPFRSKEKIAKEDVVYNLEVEENHTYTVNNLIVHNCGTTCYDGDIIEDVGVIMVRSESTKRETFVAVIESGTIDAFGYLKQDYLIVDSIGLTYEIYNEIGIEPMSVNNLLDKIDGDTKTWDIYKDGYTMCVNQAEQLASTKKAMKYKMVNVSELTQWVAGIRPSFKTMYKKFENREYFEYGILAFDNLIQDEYCKSSFILYQETLMKILKFAGFEIGETYNIIKAISKKKDYVIKQAKSKFIPNFSNAILDTKETTNEEEANELAERVWQIVEDSASYGFNCVGKDTKIMRSSSNGKYVPNVEEMYKIMNDLKYAKETNHASLHDKYKRYGYGYALSMYSDFKVRENKIIDITPSGIRQTYKVITKTGKSIECTDNHKFPTTNGEVELKNLKVGDRLYCLGKYEKTKTSFALTNGDFESNVPKKGEMGFQKKEDGVSVLYDNFRISHVENECCCEICGKKYSKDLRFEVHHKDFDRKNNSVENFQWLCVSCHKKEHYKNGRTKKYEKGIPTYLDEIISIEPYKIEQTYNIEMADPNHNFLSENGLITSNSAHAYCMAIDSVTLAWQKAYYPLEFYKVSLQWYTDKGNKDKVALLKQEMIIRGYKLNPIKFGNDNRIFEINKETFTINQTMSSIKYMQKIVPSIIYKLGKNNYSNFFFILKDIQNTEIDKKSLDILIKLDYFSEFGQINQLLEQVKIYAEMTIIFNKFKTGTVIKKEFIKNLNIPLEEVEECSDNITAKQMNKLDHDKLIEVFNKHYPRLLEEISAKYPYEETTSIDKIRYELKLLGYTDKLDQSLGKKNYVISEVEINKYGTIFITFYNTHNGEYNKYKAKKAMFKDHPCEEGDVVRAIIEERNKYIPDGNGGFTKSKEMEEYIHDYVVLN